MTQLSATRSRIVASLAVAVLMAMFVACGGAISTLGTTQEKMDPEEAGYYAAFGSLIQGSVFKCGLYIESVNSLAKSSAKDQEHADLKNAFKFIKAEVAQLEKLKSSEPPPAMAKLHEALTEMLAVAESMDEGSDSASDALLQKADLLIQEDARLTIAMRNRSMKAVPTKFKIAFKPTGIPASVDLATGTITVACDVNVGVGTVTVSPSSHEGIKTLIIRANGKSRYFLITGRSFEMPVAASMMKVEGTVMVLDADAIKTRSD